MHLFKLDYSNTSTKEKKKMEGCPYEGHSEGNENKILAVSAFHF